MLFNCRSLCKSSDGKSSYENRLYETVVDKLLKHFGNRCLEWAVAKLKFFEPFAVVGAKRESNIFSNELTSCVFGEKRSNAPHEPLWQDFSREGIGIAELATEDAGKLWKAAVVARDDVASVSSGVEGGCYVGIGNVADVYCADAEIYHASFHGAIAELLEQVEGG